MQGVNKVILVGRLSTEVECKNTNSGKLVSTCSLATNKKKQDGTQQTEFHNLVFWDKLAEIAGDYLKKGAAIYLEGSIATQRVQDQNGGADRYYTKIHVSSMQMLDSKPNDNNGGGNNNQQRSNNNNNNQNNSQRRSNNNNYNQNQGNNRNNNSGYTQNNRNNNQANNDLPDDDIPF